MSIFYQFGSFGQRQLCTKVVDLVLYCIARIWFPRDDDPLRIETCRNSYNKNQLDALISQIYFWNKTLHISDISFVHHQEFFTAHTAMVYVIQVCWQFASRIRAVPCWSCSEAVTVTCMTYTIDVCTVKNSWWWTGELSETSTVLFQK